MRANVDVHFHYSNNVTIVHVESDSLDEPLTVTVTCATKSAEALVVSYCGTNVPKRPENSMWTRYVLQLGTKKGLRQR